MLPGDSFEKEKKIGITLVTLVKYLYLGLKRVYLTFRE